MTTSSAQISGRHVFDLSYFYAIVADFRTRVQYLFSKQRYSVLMSSRGIRQRIKRHAEQAIGKRASERVKQPTCRNEIRPRAKSLKRLERVKGIEPSYSAWKAAALPLSYTRDGVELTRRAGGLNPPRAASILSSKRPCSPGATRSGALTGADSPPILTFPSTMKGGDPVSYTKRCHLAGIAR